jgi:hypothetical protein
MLKKIIFAIVILAAIWAWPEGRAKLTHFMHPVLTKLGPVGARIESPIRKYTAKTEVQGIVAAIMHAHQEGKDIPENRTFANWLRAHPVSDRKDIDPWGNGYYMIGSEKQIVVGSCGPDGVRGNADDITSIATL